MLAGADLEPRKVFLERFDVFLHPSSELGAFHSYAVVSQDPALSGDVLCCVDVVSGDHPDSDACVLALVDRRGDLSPDWVRNEAIVCVSRFEESP